MGWRDFERGSSNRIRPTLGSSWGAGFTTLGISLAAIAHVESLPGAGVFHTLIGASQSPPEVPRNFALGLSGDASGALSMVLGSTRVDFGAGLIPTAGSWYLFAGTKATGTVAPEGYMLDLITNVMATATAGGTAADRTSGFVNLDIGAQGAADYWDGGIIRTAVMEKVLDPVEVAELRYPPAWWKHHPTRNGSFVDLRSKIATDALDLINRGAFNSTGSTPTYIVTVPIGGW